MSAESRQHTATTAARASAAPALRRARARVLPPLYGRRIQRRNDAARRPTRRACAPLVDRTGHPALIGGIRPGSAMARSRVRLHIQYARWTCAAAARQVAAWTSIPSSPAAAARRRSDRAPARVRVWPASGAATSATARTATTIRARHEATCGARPRIAPRAPPARGAASAPRGRRDPERRRLHREVRPCAPAPVRASQRRACSSRASSTRRIPESAGTSWSANRPPSGFAPGICALAAATRPYSRASTVISPPSRAIR